MSVCEARLGINLTYEDHLCDERVLDTSSGEDSGTVIEEIIRTASVSDLLEQLDSRYTHPVSCWNICKPIPSANLYAILGAFHIPIHS